MDPYFLENLVARLYLALQGFLFRLEFHLGLKDQVCLVLLLILVVLIHRVVLAILEILLDP